MFIKHHNLSEISKVTLIFFVFSAFFRSSLGSQCLFLKLNQEVFSQCLLSISTEITPELKMFSKFFFIFLQLKKQKSAKSNFNSLDKKTNFNFCSKNRQVFFHVWGQYRQMYLSRKSTSCKAFKICRKVQKGSELI